MSVGSWVILYLLLTVIVGLLASRLVNNSVDFLSANRKVPLTLSSFALFAFWFGSETVFGSSSEFTQHGILGITQDPLGAFLCLILFAMLFVRPLYRQNILTLADLFRNAYGPRIELISSLFMLLTFVGYIAAQFIALSILFDILFDINPMTGRIIGAFVVILYTTFGGMWAVSITDFIQSIVIVIGFILLAIFFSLQIDIEFLSSPPKAYFYDFFPSKENGHTWTEYLAALSALGLGSLASQDIFQRANAAKTEKIAVQSTYFGAILFLIMAMFPLYLGLISLYLDPSTATSDPQYAMIGLVSNHAPIWLQIVFMGALVSAIFSTSSGALLAPSSILAENLIKPLFFPTISDTKFLFISRISVIIMGLIATWLSIVSESIYDLVAQSSVLGAVSILVPMCYALFSKASSLGALLAMFLGMAGYAIIEYELINWTIPSMFAGLASSMIGIMTGNFLAKRTA